MNSNGFSYFHGTISQEDAVTLLEQFETDGAIIESVAQERRDSVVQAYFINFGIYFTQVRRALTCPSSGRSDRSDDPDANYAQTDITSQTFSGDHALISRWLCRSLRFLISWHPTGTLLRPKSVTGTVRDTVPLKNHYHGMMFKFLTRVGRETGSTTSKCTVA